MKATRRMVWLDALRLTAGLSMVVLHATADSNGLPWVNYAASERVVPIILRTIVYSARTELFLIISVFLLLSSLHHRPRGYGAVLREQSRRLLVPFAFWVLFYAAYNLIKADAFGYRPSVVRELMEPSQWLGFFLLGDIKYHMHFLPTLFGLILFYPLFLKARQAPTLGVLVLACLLIKRELDVFVWSTFSGTEILPYFVRGIKILTYVGYGVVAGAALGILDRSTGQQRKQWLPLFGYTFVLLALIKAVGAYKTIHSGAWPHGYSAGYWADFLMPTMLFLLCLFASHLHWPSSISRLAPYSFGIYLCHPIVLDLTEVMLQHSAWSPTSQVLTKVAVALTTTSFLVWLISRVGLLAWTVGLGPLPGWKARTPKVTSLESKNVA